MSNKWLEEEQSLIENPSARIPVCLCLDISVSMSGQPIKQLNSGIEQFYSELREDPRTAESCEVALVTFGFEAELVEDFETVDKKSNVNLKTNGTTNMTAGVKLALEKLSERKHKYKNNGVDYYQPWLIIMSDGAPDNPELLAEYQQQTKTMEADQKLTVMSIGIGNHANLELLSKFSNKKPGAFTLKGLKFQNFFAFLLQSMETVIQSNPGEKVKLPTDMFKDWADI